MAFLESEPRPSGYVIRTKDLGLDTSLQTFANGKKEARDILAEFNANVSKVKKRQLEFDSSWTSEEKLHLLRFGIVPKDSLKVNWSVSEAVDLFLKAHADSVSYNTLNGYRQKLECSKVFFKTLPVKRMTKQRVQDFINNQKDQKVKWLKDGSKISIEELKKRVNHLKMLLRWCHDQQAMDADPVPMFKALRYPNRDNPLAFLWDNDKTQWDHLDERKDKLKQYGVEPCKAAFNQVFLEGPEIQRLVEVLERKLYETDSLPKRRLFVAVLFAVYTAARRSEIAKIRRRDVDLVKKTVKLRIRKGRSDGKEFVFHTIPLAEDFLPFLRQLLAELPADREFLFTGNDNHADGEVFDEKKERLACRTLSYELETALNGTEFEFTTGWHLHRHSLNSLLAAKGVSAEEAMEFVGHRTRDVHLKYRHRTLESRRETLKSVSFGGTKGTQNDGSQVASETATL